MSKDKESCDLDAARTWLKSGKERPPVIASKETSERHMSEWQGIKLVSPDDAEGIKKIKEEQKKFKEKYGSKK